ncbi:MAG: hypothetical protein HZA53_16200 [Planctomycetes bacterium]|nr:hypothetical protein [Planctomycetota bacterium]
MTTLRLLSSLLGLCGLCASWPEEAPVAVEPTTALLVTQIPHDVRGALPGLGRERARTPPPGARIVRLDLARPTEEPKVYVAGFRSAAWPDVSADGRRFLFVGQRSEGDAFQVWEARVDGGAPRQVTQGTSDCLEALYLSTLFTLDAQAPRERLGFCRRSAAGETALFTCAPDGSDEQRITYHPGGGGGPLLLEDGRLLFRVDQVPGAAPRPTPLAELLLVNVDGTDVQAFTAPAPEGVQRSRPCATPDGRVLWLEQRADADDPRLVGVARVRAFGPRSELAVHAAGELHALIVLADGSLVVARRPTDAPAAACELWRLDAASGNFTARLCATSDWDVLDATPLGPRPARPGRSSVVDETRKSGFLYCIDSRIGRDGDTLRSAASLELLAWSASGEHVLGRAPVEHDGSFYLEVPVRTPLRVRALDTEGHALEEMQSWIWVMPREARGCIGCHEDPELAPPNRQPRALRKRPFSMMEPTK